MKNPENKPLKINREYSNYNENYWLMLSLLAVAESNLVRSGKDSALPHFLAIVKELETIFGFRFEVIE